MRYLQVLVMCEGIDALCGVHEVASGQAGHTGSDDALQQGSLRRYGVRIRNDRMDAVLVREPRRLHAVLSTIVSFHLARRDVMPRHLDARTAGPTWLVGKTIEIVPRVRLPYVNGNILHKQKKLFSASVLT